MYSFIKFIPEFVDLGLPSGLKWAKCNVGAFSETESGKYFQWGDVEGRYADEIKEKPCRWKTTIWGKNEPPMTTLDSEHDAATAAYGEGYKMPTKKEIKELYENTKNEWIENYKHSGVNGMLFTSKNNGNSIFIPAAGYCGDSIVDGVGSDGYVWSSSLYSSSPNNSWVLYFISIYMCVNVNHRYFGQSVRAVTNI